MIVTMRRRILDALAYSCYKTNRELTPHVKPEDWQPCFDAPVGPMEARYQAELGQRMNDLLEKMHRNLNEKTGARCEQDREDMAVYYDCEDESAT